MCVQTVDCILLAMLREERDLFLKNNRHLIYNKSDEYEDFLEFKFVDKEGNLRKGVFCSGTKEMGNNEAGKLFYRLSRKYISELYINIGVVGYINDVNIGDVLIVSDCYSLCEKNVANSQLQKTDAKYLDTAFIKDYVFSKLGQNYLEEFKSKTKSRMKEFRRKLKQINGVDLNDDLRQTLINRCADYNEIKLGMCATYHSVVKDQRTRNIIKEIRKTNIVDMEAYYFQDWHHQVFHEEHHEDINNSKMIFIKSVSDTAIDKEKEILEKANSRSLAMANIYDVVTYYISYLHEFTQNSEMKLLEYFNNKISNRHIDKLITYKSEAYDALNNLCPYIIIEDNIDGSDFDKNYIETVCEMLKKNNKTLVLQGTPGKGKSTFISYVYKKLSEQRPSIFISIPELFKENNGLTIEQSLYLFKRILEDNKDVIVFIDSIEGSRQIGSRENQKIRTALIDFLSQDDNRNISICIGTWYIKNSHDIDIVNKIGLNNDLNILTFKGLSSFDENIKDFVLNFAKFYAYCVDEFDVNKYVNNAMRLIKADDVQLRCIDFRLLYIFAKEQNVFKRSKTIFDFIEKYCNKIAKNNLSSAISAVSQIILNKDPCDDTGLLRKNIYSRAYIFSQYICQAFINNNTEEINCILSNKYILSDNFNIFLKYQLNSNIDDGLKFVKQVLKSITEIKSIQFCSKIQLLYNISTVCISDRALKKVLKEQLLREIDQIELYSLNEQESEKIIGYRTFAIILNNVFNQSSYLDLFNKILLDVNDNIIRKINRNFHLLYYSQTEFTYDKVENENILFEPEVIWNTYQILKNSIIAPQFNIQYIETCIITLLHLIIHIKTTISSTYILSDEKLMDCLDMITRVRNQYDLKELDNLINCVKNLF